MNLIKNNGYEGINQSSGVVVVELAGVELVSIGVE